jgi:flagellar biogenesis protein FliO
MGSASCAATARENHLARILHWLAALGRSWRSHPSRQLRLRETLTLGERRFIAVVEFEQQKFLIAGTGSSVAMLTALPGQGSPNGNHEPEAVREAEHKEERHKEGREKLPEEVPTWAFTSEGPARQLIRR